MAGLYFNHRNNTIVRIGKRGKILDTMDPDRHLAGLRAAQRRRK